MAHKLNTVKKIMILGIQIALSVTLVYIGWYRQFIPSQYLNMLSFALAILAIGLGWCIFYKKPKSKRSLIAQILSLALSCALVMGSYYIYEVGRVVNLLAEDNFQTRAISVIVLNDSEIRNEQQLPDHELGHVLFVNEEIITYALEDIQKNVGNVSSKDYEDFEQLMTALYEQEVDGIILDEAFRSLIEETHETLSEDTRVIYQITKEEGSVSAKNVDVTTKPFLVFVSGNDEYGEIAAISRTDVNMLVAVNPVTHQVLLISIPRDTYYPLHRNGQYDKFTHTGMYGLEESIHTLEDMIGKDINYYVKMNFTSFINVIDALGGITVYSPNDFITVKGNYHIKKGQNKLNAKQALSFVRERKSFIDGDFERGRNQQRMIAAIVDKVSSPAILTSFSSIMDIVGESFEMNFTNEELNALIQLQLSDMPSWDIQTYQIAGYSDRKPCYSSGPESYSVVVPYDYSINQAKEYIEALMNNEKIQTEDGNLNEEKTQKTDESVSE